MGRNNKKKSTVTTLLIFSLAIFSIHGCEKKEIRNLGASGSSIVCFGDSITFGYGVEAGDDYPKALSGMVKIPVVNAGIDGDTSAEGLIRLQTDVLERQPVLVIIEFGGNDFLRKIPIESTVENVEKMIVAIQKQGSMVAIADISMDIIMGDYHNQFRRLAQQYDCIFIPNLMGGILTRPHLKSDFIHPNADGYKLIAIRVYKKISPYLRQDSLSDQNNLTLKY